MQIHQCLAHIPDVDCSDGSKGESFLFHAPTSTKHFPKATKEDLDFCPEGSRAEGDEVRRDFEEWLTKIATNRTYDPFWWVDYDPEQSPLDPEEPEIDIHLPLFEVYEEKYSFFHRCRCCCSF